MSQEFKKFTEEQDGRRKLSSAQHEEIRERYNKGGISWRALAQIYGVDKSRIGQIVNPEYSQKVSERVKKHWRDYQVKGKEWAAIQRKTREKKRRLGLVIHKSKHSETGKNPV